MPRKSSTVCSDHFGSGKLAKENPVPELKLGYKKTLKPKRKLPKVRSEIPIKRPKRDKSMSDIVGLGSSSSVVKDDNLNADLDELNEVLDCGSAGKKSHQRIPRALRVQVI